MGLSQLKVGAIFQDLQGDLKWTCVAGGNGNNQIFEAETICQGLSNVDLVGYLNFIHPNQIPVLGELEIAYFQGKDEASHQALYDSFYAIKPPAVILADGQQPLSQMVELCNEYAVPLFATQEPAARVIEVVREYLSRYFASKTSVHGVFMDIFGAGALVQGESGIGKSELALDLVSRGHALIADDVVDLSLIRQGVIEGHCPALLEGLLEVRGIGLLNVRTIFGERSVRSRMKLKLIIHLLRREVWEENFERLPTEPLTQNILGADVRKVVIPVQAGRNIAVLVEAAVRNTMLQMQGIDAYEEFTRRQKFAMQRE